MMQRFEVSEQVAWRAATLMRDLPPVPIPGSALGDYLICRDPALTEGLELAHTEYPSLSPCSTDLPAPFPTLKDGSHPGPVWVAIPGAVHGESSTVK